MGQNSSQLGSHNLQTSPRTKQNAVRKTTKPPAPPKIPKVPTYVVPENKVIPNGVQDMEKARKLLRPVSQELTKFHPDFADIFQYDPELDFLASADDSSLEVDASSLDNSNSSLNAINANVVSSPPKGLYPISNKSRKDPLILNGNATSLSKQLNSNSSNNDNNTNSVSNASNPNTSRALRRTQSMQRTSPSQTPKPGMHRRQNSLNCGPSEKPPVIMEDPREHLYNITRSQPFSNLMPSTTSLPLESSFDLDYSFNLTYAQLAEYRRQKRMNELEEKAGAKMSEMTAEIKASNTVPKSPFDRHAIGAKSGPHSVSTGSSETGVSKSKKKRAPPPPGQQNEPPADYDIDAILSNADVHRNNADVFKNKANAKSSHQRSSSSVGLNSSTNSSIPIPPPPPPAPPLPSLTSSKSQSNATASKTSKPESANASKASTSIPGEASLHQSMDLAKAQLEALKRMQDMLMNPLSKEQLGESSAKIDTTEGESKANGLSESKESKPVEGTDENLNTSTKTAESESSIAPGAKKMSTLLQHDIVLAAQAMGAKVKKSKPPATLEKPVDPAEVFRKQLAEAAQAREERRQKGTSTTGSNSIEMESTSSRSSTPSTSNGRDLTGLDEKRSSKLVMEHNRSAFVPVSDRNGLANDVSKRKNELDEEFEANGIGTHQPSMHSEDMSISSSSSQRVFSPSWVPEDDLDSDDDIRNENLHSHRKSNSGEGFKSSIVPSNIKDLKAGKKEKKNKRSKNPEPNTSTNERKKMEGVRKLKESVQSGVKNAFGSISRASGKLLKKHKSQDFLETPEMEEIRPATKTASRRDRTESNWELACSQDGSIRRVYSDADLEGYFDEDDDEEAYSSDGNSEIGDIDFSTGIDQPQFVKRRVNSDKRHVKGNRRSDYHYSRDNPQRLSTHSQGYADENVNSKSKKHGISKLLRKKFDKENDYEDSVSREIRQKEKYLSLERQRQQEMADNFRRLRDLDTQERLQRMQTANMKEQIAMLQQQQVQQAHAQLNTNSLAVSTPVLSNNAMNNTNTQSNISSNGIVNTTPSTNSTFLTSASLDFATLPSLGGTPNILGMAGHQQHNTLPLQKEALTPNMGMPILSGHFNTSQFTAHSGPLPLNGGTPLQVPPAMLPNLSTQELAYLSEYMRVMGVQPPSTQQQWAMLLSTVRTNIPQMAQTQGFGAGFPQNPITPAFHQTNNGPDLSQLFGTGKRLETALRDQHGMDMNAGNFHNPYPSQPMMQPNVSAYNHMNTNGFIPTSNNINANNSNISNHSNNGNNSYSYQTQPTPRNDIPNEANNHHNAYIQPQIMNGSTVAVQNNNTNISHNNNNTTSVQNSNGQVAMGNGQMSVSHESKNLTNNVNNSETLQTQPQLSSSGQSKFSSKAYAPIGYRPVSFHAGAVSS